LLSFSEVCKMKKKKNKWKTATIVLALFCFILIVNGLYTFKQEIKDEKIRICNTIEGTPAWVNHNGLILGYGLQMRKLNNQTIINDTELVNELINEWITYVYVDDCMACQIQKQIFGESNFKRLEDFGLTLNCGEYK